MLTIFAVIAGGIILGRILCNRNLSFLPRIITFIIWALLLLLGIEVGSNPEVIKGIGTLGLTAFLIFLFSKSVPKCRHKRNVPSCRAWDTMVAT